MVKSESFPGQVTYFLKSGFRKSEHRGTRLRRTAFRISDLGSVSVLWYTKCHTLTIFHCSYSAFFNSYFLRSISALLNAQISAMICRKDLQFEVCFTIFLLVSFYFSPLIWSGEFYNLST